MIIKNHPIDRIHINILNVIPERILLPQACEGRSQTFGLA